MASPRDYTFYCRPSGRNAYDWISRLLLLVSLVSFGFSAVLWPVTWVRVVYALLIVVIVAFWIWREKRQKTKKTYFSIGQLLAAGGWCIVPPGSFVIAILYVVFTVLERYLDKPQTIHFTEKEIVISSLFKKHYIWTDFSHIILKDGLLTLDLKNNKLIQKEVKEDNSIQETEFNEFCQEFLT